MPKFHESIANKREGFSLNTTVFVARLYFTILNYRPVCSWKTYRSELLDYKQWEIRQFSIFEKTLLRVL